jgi:hypothetical protein
VEHSPDLGVVVPGGRCVGSLKVVAARVQLSPAEQALPPAEGPPEPETVVIGAAVVDLGVVGLWCVVGFRSWDILLVVRVAGQTARIS